MIRFEAEVAPLIKQWEEVRPGEKTDRDLGTAMNKWCCDQLQEARHLCKQWLHSSDLRIDGDDVATGVQEIREIGARHVCAAQRWVDFFKDLVYATDESVAYESQQIAQSAEIFIEGWVEDFRDWARERKRSVAASASGPDRDLALPATESSIVQEETELPYRPSKESDTGSTHLLPPDQVPGSQERRSASSDLERLQTVTLAQMAAIVNKSKRSLERYVSKMPKPLVKGGAGKATEWSWSDVRPWLEKKYGRRLPERFPSLRPR